MKFITNIIRWSFGVIFFFGLVGSLSSSSFLAATVYLVLCLLLLPPTYKAIFKGNNSKVVDPVKPIETSSKPGTTSTQVKTRKSVSRGDSDPKATYANDDSVIDVSGKLYRIDSIGTADIQSSDTPEASAPPGQLQATRYIQSFESNIYHGGYDKDQWQLGKRLKQKLELTTHEVSLLNKVVYFDNVFTSIEGCCITTARLYLNVIKDLKKQLQRKGTSMAKEIQFIQELAIDVYKSEDSFYWNSYDYDNTRQRVITDIHVTIFKRCEFAVREAFLHKRRISTNYTGNNDKLAAEFETRLGGFIDAAVGKLIVQVEQPDEVTEIELNAQNVTRWRTQLEKLSEQLTPDSKDVFIKEVYHLGRLNRKNPSVENIFFEASKIITKHDKEEALRFYLHYLQHDLNSVTVDNKKLNKTIQKSLFKDADQLKRYEEVLNQFMEDKDLEKALSEIPTVYTKRRKKIQLDISTIHQVQQQHSGTVELLNEYLQDEDEPAVSSVVNDILQDDTSIAGGEELQLQLKAQTTASPDSLFLPELPLNEVQQELLQLFQANSLSLSQQQVELFSKERGMFRNQLIDSINESCFEQVDDVLIEEEGEHYSIYENYFQTILKNDR